MPTFRKLSLLVENMGRINYGHFLHDYKGIVGDIKLGEDVVSKGIDWNIWCLPLNNTNLAQFEVLNTEPGLKYFPIFDCLISLQYEAFRVTV